LDVADRKEGAAVTKALAAPYERIWKVLNHLKNGTTDE
jgi:hypothetical protein